MFRDERKRIRFNNEDPNSGPGEFKHKEILINVQANQTQFGVARLNFSQPIKCDFFKFKSLEFPLSYNTLRSTVTLYFQLTFYY